ncbi:MAG: type 12 methyltransferase [Parcubacteria group bacterium Gr01-1014_70]|nr:MAG: type 12 methyltransferase [Parcubacteria group bacterium Gr01-1014_70]
MVAHKQAIIEYFDAHADERDQWKKKNWYYHQTVELLLQFFVPAGSTVLEIGAGTGGLLSSLRPARGVGVDISPRVVEKAKKQYPQHEWHVGDAENLMLGERFDYVVASDLIGYLDDIEVAFRSLSRVSNERTRVVITYYNYIWEPVLRLAEVLHLKAAQPLQNWLSSNDIEHMLYLAGFEIIKSGKKMLMPVYIPLISTFCNRVIGNLPLFSRLGLIQYVIARPLPNGRKEHSVSIIIPARNEKGNIERAVLETPDFGSYNELIFVEGHSKDGTLEEIRRVAKAYAGKRNIRWATQEGTGKGDAVRKGFSIAEGEVLMILDADLTVRPQDLLKFYEAIASGRGEFVNGSRLVYPLEKESMRFFNIMGNKFFSVMFTWLLGQRIKDTLCGTKVLYKKDYDLIAKGRTYFGEFDPFGDFDLLFGAAKLNLRFAEVPVRYQARTYGSTNIQRWKHGWLLLKMVVFAIRKIKFI